MLRSSLLAFTLALSVPLLCGSVSAQGTSPANPILFCTQVPNPSNYTTVTSTFGNHRAKPESVVRGGDLMIRYPDGSLRNLTREAGFGAAGLFQSDRAIAVREPCVHWSGTRALFSMVVGAPPYGHDVEHRWEIYEVRGLGQGQQVAIFRVPGQPSLFNNVSPFYLSNGRVACTSDRPRNGALHLYPQLDEYEEAATNTGIWSFDPFQTNGSFDLKLLNHAPSGAFRPTLDSFGRIIFTRWDHLERDQQKDIDALGAGNYGTFNYSDESANASWTANFEWFPEPRSQWVNFVNANPGFNGDLNGYQSWMVGNDFNHFLPWMLRQDGTGEETVNHAGRHELFSYFARARNDDPTLENFYENYPNWVTNRMPIGSLHQIREDANVPGLYYAVNCREFDTHAAGQIVSFYAPEGDGGHEIDVRYVTHAETADPTLTPTANHSGLYRTPLRTSDGFAIASHTPNTAKDSDQGGNYAGFYWPISTYDFRIKQLDYDGTHWRAGAPLTNGIQRVVVWTTPWNWRAWYGDLWELDPVEVVARPMPPVTTEPYPEPAELAAIGQTGVSVGALKNYLRNNDLALMVVRDATARDDGDHQQPYNLRVAGSGHTNAAPFASNIREVSHLQLFQADQLRSLNYGGSSAIPGRRVLAWPMHDAPLAPSSNAPPGGVGIAADGSVATLVPANRAMTWQLTDAGGEGVVRERYWLSFQPGEIRSCDGCHGVNDHSQSNQPAATNTPQALTELVQWLQGQGQL